MHGQVDVRTQALVDLRLALLIFRGHAGEQLRTISRLLQQFAMDLQRQEQISQEQVRQAQNFLHQLRRRNSDVETIQRAADQLRQAEDRLSKIRYHQREVIGAIQAYHKQAQRLNQYLEHEVPKATVFLSDKLTILDQYRATKGEVSDQSLGPSEQNSETVSPTPIYLEFIQFVTKMRWVSSVDWGGVFFVALLSRLTPQPETAADILVYYQLYIEYQPLLLSSIRSFLTRMIWMRSANWLAIFQTIIAIMNSLNWLVQMNIVHSPQLAEMFKNAPQLPAQIAELADAHELDLEDKREDYKKRRQLPIRGDYQHEDISDPPTNHLRNNTKGAL